MNNNLYHWHDEKMVELEMREFKREMEQARLLKEAGLADSSVLARAVSAVRRLLAARRRGHQAQSSLEPQSHPFQSEKMAR